MDVVWRRGSNGAREPTIAPHRSIMSRPASLKDFQEAVYVWAGVQPEKVRIVCHSPPLSDCAAENSDRALAARPQLTFTVGGSQEPLQESNYHSLETEHDIVAELVDDDTPANEDVTTVDGLKARRERLSTGEGARSRCKVHLAIDVILTHRIARCVCSLGPSVSELSGSRHPCHVRVSRKMSFRNSQGKHEKRPQN